MVKGLFKYIENKHDGPGSKAFIRRSRIVQGERDLWSLEKDSSEEGREQLQRVRDDVDYGWGVYENIWAEAQKQFGPVGGNLIGRHRMRREKKMWDVNGALENVDTASRALRARKEGRDLDRYFGERREEMRRAEEPRVAAMDSGGDAEAIPASRSESGRQISDAGPQRKDLSASVDRPTTLESGNMPTVQSRCSSSSASHMG